MCVSSKVALLIVIVIVEHVFAQDPNAVILQSANALDFGGVFAYGFETSNGILVEARGKPAKSGGQAISGRFSWIAPGNSKPLLVQYTADERGYQPIGDHLPTPPPIPLAILRAIDYNDRHPEQDDSQRSP